MFCRNQTKTQEVMLIVYEIDLNRCVKFNFNKYDYHVHFMPSTKYKSVSNHLYYSKAVNTYM